MKLLTKHLTLIKQLQQQDYISAKQLAEILSYSSKAVGYLVDDINSSLDKNIAYIEKSAHKGYHLEIVDEKRFQSWLLASYRESKENPQDQPARVKYILEALLFKNKYVKREDLADELFVSEKTISKDFKKIEELLADYDLALERKPYYGVHVVGNEFNIRQCLLNEVIDPKDRKDLKVKKSLEELVLKIIENEKIEMDSYQINHLIDYLALSIKRIREGKVIIDDSMNKWGKDIGIYYLAKYILENIKEFQLIEDYFEAEVYYASLYILASELLNEKNHGVLNYVIPSHTRKWSKQMEEVLVDKYEFSLDDIFSNCLLHQTVVSEVRTKFRIHIDNPYRKEIQQKYPVSFEIARDITAILEKMLNKKVDNDEIAHYTSLINAYLPKVSYRLHAYAIVDEEKSEDLFTLGVFKDKFYDYVQVDEVFDFNDFADEFSCDCLITSKPLETAKDVIVLQYSAVLNDFADYQQQVKDCYLKAKQNYLRKMIQQTYQLTETEAQQDLCTYIPSRFNNWNCYFIEYLKMNSAKQKGAKELL